MKSLECKALIFCSVCALFIGCAFAAFAEDTLIINKSNDSIVTGTVTDVTGDMITLDNNNNPIRVNLDKLNLDQGVRDILALGTRITVRGRFTDFGATPEIKADSVVRNTGENLTGTEAVLLNNQNH